MKELNAAKRLNSLRASTKIISADTGEAGKALAALTKILGTKYKTKKGTNKELISWTSPDWAAILENRAGSVIWFTFQTKRLRKGWFSAYGTEPTAASLFTNLQAKAKKILDTVGDDPKLQSTRGIIEHLAKIK